MLELSVLAGGKIILQGDGTRVEHISNIADKSKGFFSNSFVKE